MLTDSRPFLRKADHEGTKTTTGIVQVVQYDFADCESILGRRT